MIGWAREKSKQYQIAHEKMMSHKKNILEQNAVLLSGSSFEKGLEDDIEALYHAEEINHRAQD